MGILVVEDSPQQGKLLEHILKKGGFSEIVLAESAREAFRILGMDGPVPVMQNIDLILMDLLLPDMNGIEACRFIMKSERASDIPVIVVTGVSDLDSLQSAFDSGAIDYIVKPVRKVELLARVRSVLKIRQQEDALRKSQARYRAVVEDQSELICRFLPDGTLTFVNDAYCRYFGLERPELMGQNFLPSFAEEDRKDVLAQIGSLGAGNEAVSGQYRVALPDGRIRWQHKSIRAILDEQGRIVEIQSVGRDITEQKRAEEGLQQAYAELERRVEERTLELKEKTHHLEEVNTALKILLKQREADKEELEEAVLSNVKNLIFPYVEKLRATRLNKDQLTYVEILESHLNEITSPFVKRLSQEFLGLTPMEVRIADLIREGKTTKEIAELLHRSDSTILFHRDNIRDKLGLKVKKINLRSYLRSFH